MRDERERSGRTRERAGREASYDEASRSRFGTGGGRFGFGAGGEGLPWVFLFMVLALVGVAARLFFLQVVDGDRLAQLGEKHRTNEITLQARRGTIYDRNGNVLATSEDCYDVYCNPKEITDPDKGASLVARWLGGDAAQYKDVLVQDTTYAYLALKADKDSAEALRDELISEEYHGIYLEAQTRRVYPYGEVCGQVLGRVNDYGEAKSGLEYTYDAELSGHDGKKIMEAGLGGIPIAGAAAEVEEPVDGADIVLSIDVDVQRFAEEQVAAAMEECEAKSGFCMVCDPRNGEIIAACSTPYADLTHPELMDEGALNLKMVSDCYEPGSTFKVITAAIGLESGTVQASTYFSVPPSILVGQDLVVDMDDRWEYSEMNLREVLRRSSNVGAALIAQEAIGADTFAQGVESFGIGHATGIDYPGEVDGIVKTRSQYDGSSVGSMSFGQGLSIPMVQLVRAVGCLANKGVLTTPHFAVSVGGKDLEWPDGERAVSEGTAEKVTDMMRTVVEDGTGITAQVPGFDVAAKTGTGEQAVNGKYIKDKYLASVVGFAPAQNPEVLVYVGLNETPFVSYSSAGPLFSAIMGEVLADMGVLS